MVLCCCARVSSHSILMASVLLWFPSIAVLTNKPGAVSGMLPSLLQCAWNTNLWIYKQTLGTPCILQCIVLLWANTCRLYTLEHCLFWTIVLQWWGFCLQSYHCTITKWQEACTALWNTLLGMHQLEEHVQATRSSSSTSQKRALSPPNSKNPAKRTTSQWKLLLLWKNEQ